MSEDNNEYPWSDNHEEEREALARFKKAQVDKEIESIRKLNLSYEDLLRFAAGSVVSEKELLNASEVILGFSNKAQFVISLFSEIADPDSYKAHLAALETLANNDNWAAQRILTGIKLSKNHLAKSVASKGGRGRSAKIELCENETIRLYRAGKWKNAPEAAQAITPQIVEFSKKAGANLAPTTTKPLEWIRKHNKEQKSSPS